MFASNVLPVLRLIPLINCTPEATILWKVTQLDGVNDHASFAHAFAAVEQAIWLPPTRRRIVVPGTICVDLSAVPVDFTLGPDGVVFQIATVDETDQPLGVYDPRVSDTPIPFEIDLSAYSGQVMRLHYSILPRECFGCDWLRWVNLHLVKLDAGS